jgi:hypothetical protein
MQRLYLARDRIEAQFLRDFLDRHLIETVVLGDYLAGAAGQLPADIFPEVWVLDDDDLERARELLPRFINQSKADPGGAPWTCEACGKAVEDDFSVCWNCGRPRPMGPQT